VNIGFAAATATFFLTLLFLSILANGSIS
jgi:hypothetical protein